MIPLQSVLFNSSYTQYSILIFSLFKDLHTNLWAKPTKYIHLLESITNVIHLAVVVVAFFLNKLQVDFLDSNVLRCYNSQSKNATKLVAMQWHRTKSVLHGHLGTWSESDARRTHQYVSHHFMNVVKLVERRWQLGNAPRGTVNKFKLNCNAMKLKFIQYPSVEAHSTMLNSTRFFHLLLSSCWLSLSLSLSFPSPHSHSNRIGTSIEWMSTPTSMPKRMAFLSSSWMINTFVHAMFHCHRMVKHKCKRFPCRKFSSNEMLITSIGDGIKCNVGLDLYLFGVSNPHATKSENQTKLYFQFQWKCNNTPSTLSHMYASMLYMLQCFIDEFTKFLQSCCLTNLPKIR